ncbi:HAMP domain-containing protein [Amycolatopsis acidicola]|uniref:histidine kinase n=1 Tax=Amycolatopsis acidicola TaxID=2596893 RepID=A0A5N0VJH5_9PSEU|nr:ATP-binding protein [Amycolatopsis acidicola]KAA9165633.1 HAMP domain-containing protein [Amycolatopsis acidicola]
MEDSAPAARVGGLTWPPTAWSLRTKIAAVLLLPTIVALTLAGIRIDSELDQANRLSAVRDQLSIVRDTLELADLLDQELVASAANPTPTAQIDAVDAKVAALQQDVDFAVLPADTSRTLNTSLGKLSGLRASGDPVAKTTGYHEIVTQLSNIPPTVIGSAGNTDLNAPAYTLRSLIQLRSALAVQETLLRSVRSGNANQAELAAAAQSAAEESAIHSQVARDISPELAPRLTNALAALSDRQAVLQSALVVDRTPELSGLLLPIANESASLGDLIAGISATLSGTVTDATNAIRSKTLRDAALVIGALLSALAIALLMARSLLSPVRRLHTAALTAAHEELPQTIQRVRDGEDISWESVEPVGVETGEEIGQLARAFEEMHRQAIRLAGEQAELRKQVSEMFMTLARRSQSMVELQLTVLEGLESNERDPQRLDELFRLDHLATRLRRNGENLQVLAGGSPSRHDHGPVSMVELLRGATSEVKDYRRIKLANVPGGSVRSQAAADIVHILAELLENATRFSPPEAKVVLTADRGSDGGLLVEVVDHGLGMTQEDLDKANHRLAAGDTVSPETARRMGLFVVGRLASLHGVTVRLRLTGGPGGEPGITASVHVPGALIIADSGTARQSLVNGVAPKPNGTSLENYPSLNEISLENYPTLNGSSHGTLPVANGVPSGPHPLPERKPQAPMNTPIFENVVSNWFTEHSPDTPEPAQRSQNWLTAADDARRAAEDAVRQSTPATISPAGLPTRTPGAQLAPGAALPRERPGGRQATTDFRDATAVRNNLSRHYNGMRAARQRTAHEEGS